VEWFSFLRLLTAKGVLDKQMLRNWQPLKLFCGILIFFTYKSHDRTLSPKMWTCKLFLQFFRADLAAINLKRSWVFCVAFIHAGKLGLFGLMKIMNKSN